VQAEKRNDFEFSEKRIDFRDKASPFRRLIPLKDKTELLTPRMDNPIIIRDNARLFYDD
jgi:hypothetical protein